MDDPQTVLRTHVPEAAAGLALLDWLVGRFRYLDRSAWASAIDQGRVCVDGVVVPATFLLTAGAEVAYQAAEEPFADTRIHVVFEDARIVVVDKPAHLICHGDGPFIRKTLLHLLTTHLTADGVAPVLRLVHRLDRETSGLVVLAKTRRACRELEGSFGRGQVKKRYLAVVHGAPAEDEFVVDRNIGRSKSSSITIRRAAGEDAGDDARPAITRFRVLHRSEDHAVLEAWPETGRTHQIRVHLESISLPVVGDKLYGRSDAQYLQFVHAVKGGQDPRECGPSEPRQMLHAQMLTFPDPGTGVSMTFEADPPPDFLRWIEAVERNG